MQSPVIDEGEWSGAESSFRDAFERLKHGRPRLLPAGSKPSQNNVAREAGRDPSALRKSRYPDLVTEIQLFARGAIERPAAPTIGQQLSAARRNNKDLRRRIEQLKSDRDLAQSMLLEAHTLILSLSRRLEVVDGRQAKVTAAFFGRQESLP